MSAISSCGIHNRGPRRRLAPVAVVLGAAMVAMLLVAPLTSAVAAPAIVQRTTRHASAPGGPGLYHPMTPARLVDTRCAASPEPSFCASEHLPSTNAGLGTLQTTSAHPSWSAPQEVAPNLALSSVSCPTASFCMAVGSDNFNGYALTDTAGTWSAPQEVAPNVDLNSVSCPTASFCMAVGQDGSTGIVPGYALTDTAGTWSAPQEVAPDIGLWSVSCPTASFCMAVGGGDYARTNGYSFTDTAGTWSAPQKVAPYLALYSVSCPTASFCMAVGSNDNNGNGYVLTDTAGTWSAPQEVAPNVALWSVSCPTASFCMAVGGHSNGNGYALTYGTSARTTITAQVTGVNGIPSTGVQAIAATVTATNTTGSGYLTVWPAGANRPLASTLNWKEGESVANSLQVPVSASGQISLFNGSTGDVDVIVDVTGWYGTGTSTGVAGALVPLLPYRIADTRCSESPKPYFCTPENLPVQNASLKSIPARSSIAVQVAATGAIPSSNVTAAVATFTVDATGTSAAGYLTVWPSGEAMPTTSILNWAQYPVVADTATVALSQAGQISIYNGSSYPVDVIVDVSGYYTTRVSSAWTTFTPITPTRICDTRPTSVSGISDACTGHALEGGKTLVVNVAGQGGLPSSGVSAVVANVTVISPTAQGYLTVVPDLMALPEVSTLDFQRNQIVASLMLAAIPYDGALDFYLGSSLGSTANLAVDVVGYYSSLSFAAPSPPVGIAGEPYSLQLQATGGVAPYAWKVDWGNLPPGLSLDPATGLISGATTICCSDLVGIGVTDSTPGTAQQVSQPVTFHVAEPNVPLITLVSPIRNTNNPSFVIEGTNFGNAFPSSDINQPATTPYLEVFDCMEVSGCAPGTSSRPKWTSGYSPGGDMCQLTVKAWSNTAIAVQFDTNISCPFNTNQILGVIAWDTNISASTSAPSFPMDVIVGDGYVWGYCLNGHMKQEAGIIGAGVQGCAVESGPNDVALLWSTSFGLEPAPTTFAKALTDLSNLNCTLVCFGGGDFGFGSDATSTSQFGTGTSFQTVSAGESTGILPPLSLGAAFTMFQGNSVIGVMAGLSAGGLGLSYGVGSITWNVVHLTGNSASLVSQGLQDMKDGAIVSCVAGVIGAVLSLDPNVAQAALGACAMAVSPYAGYYSNILTSLFNTLSPSGSANAALLDEVGRVIRPPGPR